MPAIETAATRRDPATIARELTRGQRHALVTAKELPGEKPGSRLFLPMRIVSRVRRNLELAGLVDVDGGFLTPLGERVRASMLNDPVQVGRYFSHPVQRALLKGARA